MAKIVTKFRYLKQGKGKTAGNYANYIATREGVDKLDDNQKLAASTIKQKQFIEQLVQRFPDTKRMLEYQDYQRETTVGNATELIERVLEEHADEDMTGKTYADYIATRPRAERFGSHGLFTDDGIHVQLSEVSEELNLHEGNIWTMILSMRREDAERLGFDTGSRWRDMLRTQTEAISTNFKIPMENLKWFGAFHNESHHPHVHLIVYSKDPREGYLSKQGIENLRSSFARDLFALDLMTTYREKTMYRDDLRREGKRRIESLIEELKRGQFQNERMEILIRALAKGLQKHRGRKVYAYLKPELKNYVDEIVEEMSKDKRVQELYDFWYEKQEEVLSSYSTSMPQRAPLSRNPEFLSLKNVVIQEVALLTGMDLMTVGEKAVVVSEGTMRLMGRVGNIFQEKLQDPKQENSVSDRKLKRQLMEKKQAQGLRHQ